MAITESFAAMRTFRRSALLTALLAWIFAVLLVVAGGTTPHASAQSRFHQFGALQVDGVPALVSHRGAALDAPENTVAAIRTALEQGAEAVELDVQLTQDDVPVLIHDPTVQRTTDGWGRVTQMTAAEIGELDAGSWFHPDFAGERVPTLAAALEVLQPAPINVFLELKDDWSDAQLAPLVADLRRQGMLNRVVLQSFNVDTLGALQRIAPEFARVMLTRQLGGSFTERALELGVSGVGAKSALFAAFPDAAAELRSQGLGIAVYTLNSAVEWSMAADFGVDLVITDDPHGYSQWRVTRETTAEPAG